MNSTKINLQDFYFNHFQKEAIEKLKSRQSLTGKEDISTPLVKEILESALEGKTGSNFSECMEQG